MTKPALGGPETKQPALGGLVYAFAVDYTDWLIFKGIALCVAAFVYGFWQRIIETRPPAKHEPMTDQEGAQAHQAR